MARPVPSTGDNLKSNVRRVSGPLDWPAAAATPRLPRIVNRLHASASRSPPCWSSLAAGAVPAGCGYVRPPALTIARGLLVRPVLHLQRRRAVRRAGQGRSGGARDDDRGADVPGRAGGRAADRQGPARRSSSSELDRAGRRAHGRRPPARRAGGPAAAAAARARTRWPSRPTSWRCRACWPNDFFSQARQQRGRLRPPLLRPAQGDVRPAGADVPARHHRRRRRRPDAAPTEAQYAEAQRPGPGPAAAAQQRAVREGVPGVGRSPRRASPAATSAAAPRRSCPPTLVAGHGRRARRHDQPAPPVAGGLGDRAHRRPQGGPHAAVRGGPRRRGPRPRGPPSASSS